MRYHFGTALVFLGPLLAGLTYRPLVSVIVYAGLMFWWLLKVRPVAAPSPGRIAALIGVLTVLAGLVHTVGALSASVFGLAWQLPFWLPAAVSLLGVILARPPAGTDPAPLPAAPPEPAAPEAPATLDPKAEATLQRARAAGDDPVALAAALAPLDALPAEAVAARLERESPLAAAVYVLRPRVAAALAGSGATGRALERALRHARAEAAPALAQAAAGRALALAEAMPGARRDLPDPMALRALAVPFRDTPAADTLARLADRLDRDG